MPIISPAPAITSSSKDQLFQDHGSLTRKSWAPPRVKFFIWLACQDRCWTGAQLARRGLPHLARCPCATSLWRLWRTSLPAAPSRGRSGTSCCHGYDRLQGPSHGGGFHGLVVASVADHPSPATQVNLVIDHAHGLVEASERNSL